MNRFIPLHSTQSGAVPTSSFLNVGELAVNVADGILYTKNQNSQIIRLISVPSGTVSSSQQINTGSFVGNFEVQSIIEQGTVTTSPPSPTVDYDVIDSPIVFYSASTTSNWTVNFRGNVSTTLDSILNVGESVSVVMMVINSTPAYSASGYQIDGTSIAPFWQNGNIPQGNTNSIDAHTYTIMKTGTSQYVLLASLTEYA